jgi:hypothetical protein
VNERLGSFWPSVDVVLLSKKASPSSERSWTEIEVAKALENETST